MKLAVIANPKVREILLELIDSDIPIQASWKIKKMVYKFDEHHTMYKQSELDLIKKYAVLDTDGEMLVGEKGEISVDPANMEKWTAEMTELVNVDIDMPTVSIKDFGNKIDLKPKKLIILDGLVVD
jgi:hypothetical protein